MNEIDNALSDRFKRAPATSPVERSLFPAEARAEAERRLHEAWLSETARQTVKVEDVAPVAPSAPVAPVAPVVPAVDPRTAILGQLWEATSDDPKWVAPPVPVWTVAKRAGDAVPQDQEWVRPHELNTPPAEPAPAPQYFAPAPQYAPPAPQYAAPAPQYAPPAPQYAAPAPQYAPQPTQPFTPVAPQRASSSPPSDDATLRNEIIDNLEFARQRVEELRKLQEWRLGQERRVSEEIGRRNALAEAALEEELQARREAEEHRIERWKAEARAQLERDLAREEAEFERRLADRRRDAEVELEARLLRRLDDAARRAEALEKGRGDMPQPAEAADPRLYVVRSAG